MSLLEYYRLSGWTRIRSWRVRRLVARPMKDTTWMIVLAELFIILS